MEERDGVLEKQRGETHDITKENPNITTGSKKTRCEGAGASTPRTPDGNPSQRLGLLQGCKLAVPPQTEVGVIQEMSNVHNANHRPHPW